MWDKHLPTFYDYLLYVKEHSEYKVNDYKKKFAWLSKRLPFPFTLPQTKELVLYLKKKKLSSAYINYWITAINTFIGWCQIERLPQEDFSRELNKIRPKIDRIPDPKDLLSIDQVKLLITNPSNRPIQNKNLGEYFKRVDDMYSLLFEFIYKTGCRSGEAIALKKNCFNYENRSLTFYETKIGGKRVVAIPPDMEERLKEYMKDLNDTDYLFRRNKNLKENKPISQEMVNRAFKYRARLTGINRPVHIHMLRHSRTSHLLKHGAPLATVQAIIGHKRINTTQLYLHVLVDDQREVMIRYDPFLRESGDITAISKYLKGTIFELHLEEKKKLGYAIEETKDSFSFKVFQR